MRMSEYLSTARAKLDQGWIKGEISSAQGVCTVGALLSQQYRLSEEDHGIYDAACLVVRRKIGEMWPENFVLMDGLPSFVDFNDAPERTKDDVLAVYDKAILSAQERGE
jgi:hypothetical protein